LPLELAAYKLEGFCQQWQTRLEQSKSSRFMFRVASPVGFWQRCLGRQPGLSVKVEFGLSRTNPLLTNITVQVTPAGCRRPEGEQVLRDLGPVVIESLRTHLHVDPERRAEKRFPWHSEVQVLPVFAAQQFGEPIACQGKDISLNGIGLYAPQQLQTDHIVIQLPAVGETTQIQIGGKIVSQQQRLDGWLEAGVLLQR
jgi:hypothetical protein